MANKLIIDIDGDTTGLESKLSGIDRTGTKAFGSVESSGVKAFNNIGKALAAAGIAIGLKQIADGFKKAISLASDLEEVQNVVDVTFGKGNKKIENFAKGAADSFGMSELSAKKFSGTMGAMLKSMDVAPDAVEDMSLSMVGLTGDMASFYNLSHEETFAKIRSGISGETEPLKQLGINLSVANLEAFALSEGIETSYNSMTEAEKVTLRYNYLMKATADAQGDFERTSGSFANQMKIMKLHIENAATALGKMLLPTVTKVIKSLNELAAKALKALAAFKNTTVFKQFKDSAVEAFGKIKDALSNAFGDFDGESILSTVFTGLGNIFKGIGDVLPGLIEGLGQVWDVLSPIISSIASFVAENAALIVKILTVIIVVRTVASVFLNLINVINVFSAVFPVLAGILSGVAGVIGLIIAAVAVLALAWYNDWGGIREKTAKVVEEIQEKIQKFKDWIENLKINWDALKTEIGSYWDLFQASEEGDTEKANAIAKQIVDDLKTALDTNANTTLVDWLTDLPKLMIAGITVTDENEWDSLASQWTEGIDDSLDGKVSNVTQWFLDLPVVIVDAVKFKKGDFSALAQSLIDAIIADFKALNPAYKIGNSIIQLVKGIFNKDKGAVDVEISAEGQPDVDLTDNMDLAEAEAAQAEVLTIEPEVTDALSDMDETAFTFLGTDTSETIENIDAVKTAFETMKTEIDNLFVGWWGSLSGYFTEVTDGIIKEVTTIRTEITTLFTALEDADLVNSVMGQSATGQAAGAGMVGEAGAAADTSLLGMLEALHLAFKSISEIMPSVNTGISTFKGLLGGTGDEGGGILGSLNGIVAMLGDGGAFPTAMTSLAELLGDPEKEGSVNSYIQITANMFERIAAAMLAIENMAKETLITALTTLSDYWEDEFKVAVTAMESLIYSGANSLYKAFGSIKGVMEDILSHSNSIANTFNGELTSAFRNIMTPADIAEGAIRGVASACQSLSDWAYSAAAALRDLAAAMQEFGGGGGGISVDVNDGLQSAATGGWRGAGLTLVGENGPEIISTSRSMNVFKNADTVKGLSIMAQSAIASLGDRARAVSNSGGSSVQNTDNSRSNSFDFHNATFFGEQQLRDFVEDIFTENVRKGLNLAS